MTATRGLDTDAVLDLLREAADELVVPRFRHLEAGEVMEKNPGDLVTVADREAEAFITARLADAYPDAVILGEEACAADPRLLERFAAAEHGFTLDPVDGTRNFVHGRDRFAVMASEVVRGQTVRAWIWQPGPGVAWVAEHGAGVERDGHPVLAPVPAADPDTWRGLTARPTWKGQEAGVGELADSFWCCGYDYPALCSGAVDYVLYVHGAPWDHFPGTLMVRELGGDVRLWDGGVWRPEVQQRGLVAGVTPTLTDRVFGRLAYLWT